ncbi:MAG: phytanoyl-CoA dioxygenase family protein [Planctomycetaceae bacterium]|nr:phytanoyl-CoA dioxygenase family protein [Planctomycetaceae bacterium]
MLNPQQHEQFLETGHITVEALLTAAELQQAIDDIQQWAAETLATLSDEQKAWYLEQTQAADSNDSSSAAATAVLRKLDHPVYHRPVFRQLAAKPEIVAIVEQLIGQGVSVFFSQVFMKAAGGGPKPVHQDNFYFGPDDPDHTLTVWIAIDDAGVDNGCLFYGDGSHRGAILRHVAPPGEPFNLQVEATTAAGFPMTPAPVPAGGISFHHGNTLHQSSANLSSRSRRAVALHYLRNRALLTHPALSYDEQFRVRITG